MAKFDGSALKIAGTTMLALAAFAAMWSSLLIGMVAMICVATFFAPDKNRGLIFAVAATVATAIFTLYKAPDGDEFYYLLYIDRLRGYGAGYLGNEIISVRPTEPIFIVLTKIVSYFPYGKILFIITLIATVYLFSSYAYIKIAERLHVNTVPILIFSFLLSINMFGAAQLMRQYMAMGIASLAFIFIVDGRFRWAFLGVAASAAVHNANALLFIPFLAAFTVKKRPLLTYAGLTFLALAGYWYFSRQQVLLLDATEAERWMAAFSKDDGSVPVYLIAIDVALLAALLFAWIKDGREDVVLERFTTFAFGVGAVLLAVSDQNLLFLRSYVIVEFVRPLAIMFLLKQVRLGRDSVVGVTLIAVSSAFFIYRVNNLVFDYGGQLDDIVAIGLADFYARVVSFDLY